MNKGISKKNHGGFNAAVDIHEDSFNLLACGSYTDTSME